MKKRRSAPAESGGGSDWLATYCDMVTLLMTFFILLFAMSQVDVQKWNIIVASLSNRGASAEEIMRIGSEHTLKSQTEFDINDPRVPLPLGAEKEIVLQDAYDIIKKAIEESGVGEEKISISLGDDYILIRFLDDMLFGPNSAVVRTEDYQYLDFVGKSLQMIEDEVGMIRIDGHTAAVPEQPDYPVSDRDLSSARANAVLKYFEDNVGIRGDKLQALALGKQYPFASNDTEEGRRKNRRIEILVTETNEIADQLSNIYEKLVE